MKIIFFISSVLIFFYACRNTSDENILLRVQGGIENSNKSIRQSTEHILKSLEDKRTDPATKERADYWFSKAIGIKKMTEKMISYIEALKKEKTINISESNELLHRLYTHRKNITAIDSSIRQQFSIDVEIGSEEAGKKDFYNRNFKNSDVVHIVAILSRIENDIILFENNLVVFCNNNVGMLDGPGFCDFYSAILAQNTTILKPGETLELTAGIGEYRREPQTKILIGGTAVPLNEEGYAIYKVRVSKPGKHSIPVTISFLSSTTGKEETLSKNVEYTVAKECDQ